MSIPGHMRASAQRWIDSAEPHPSTMGAFLRAVLLNNLADAYAYADADNTAAMHDWARWLYNDVPSPAWGSPEKLDAWYTRHHSKEQDD